jgi:hypothetical protein
MFEVLDVHGNVIAVFGARKRGTAFAIDEQKLKTARVWQPPHQSGWLLRLFFPLLLPVDTWIGQRFR